MLDRITNRSFQNQSELSVLIPGHPVWLTGDNHETVFFGETSWSLKSLIIFCYGH